MIDSPEVHVQNGGVTLNLSDDCVEIRRRVPVSETQISLSVVRQLPELVLGLLHRFRVEKKLVESGYQSGCSGLLAGYPQVKKNCFEIINTAKQSSF